MRVLVTGGAGFIGSHLTKELVTQGNEVICLDDLSTGLADRIRRHGITIIQHDVIKPFFFEVDAIFHLACKPSPRDYLKEPERTFRVNVEGTKNAVDLAKKLNVPIFLASTIKVHDETNRDPYVEGKREAERIALDYPKSKVGRLHSTIGQGMSEGDGRVLPVFLARAKRGEDLIITQDRIEHFCFVDDIVREILRFMSHGQERIRDIGDPFAISILALAKLVITITGSESRIVVKT